MTAPIANTPLVFIRRSRLRISPPITGMREVQELSKEHKVRPDSPHGQIRVKDSNATSAETPPILARHQLLTHLWTANVQALEAAIRQFRADAHPPNRCEVMFFELVGDDHLHVNVTHKYATRSVRGWAGPGSMPDGFIHNRRFGDTPQDDLIRHIRDMVFAARV